MLRFVAFFALVSLWFPFLACAAETPAGVSEYRLVFQETIDVKGKPKRTQQAEVILGPHYVWMISGGTRRLYNFDMHRIYFVSDAKKSYSDASLFSDLAFRVNEIRGRAAMPEVDRETLFGVTMPDKQAGHVAFEKKVEAGTWTFKHGGKDYVTFKPDPRELPHAFQKGYGRFLTYHVPMHPDVRRQIVDTGKLPAKLTTVIPGDATQSANITLELKEAGPMKTLVSTKVPGGYLEIQPKELDSLKPNKADTIPRVVGDVYAFVKDATARGDLVDVSLALTEWTLMTGEQLSLDAEAMKVFADKGKTDKNLQLLHQAESTISGKEKQLEAVTKLNALPLKKKYVLDVLRGKILAVNGKLPEAIAAAKKAIVANPRMVGAYADLGEYYYKQYQMPIAFEVWDRGASIMPLHPSLKKVKELQARLQHDFPDYF
jgi:hypothetical protein